MTSITADGASTEVWIREIAGTKTYSVNAGSSWSALTGPVTVTNTGAASNNFLRVIFKTDITIDSTNFTFLCNSDYIQFGSTSLNENGSRPTFTVNNVVPYDGLIANSGYNAIRVLNLQMTSTGTCSLTNGGGWFGQAFFGDSATGNFFVNCSTDSTLTISSGSGGIVGVGAAQNAGAQMDIIGCSSAGEIQGFSGGIVGQYAAQNGGTLRVSQCWSSGQIYGDGGGICGGNAGRFGGNITVANCYSSGMIVNTGGGGGIFGSSAGVGGTVAANYCYSTGTIGAACGGIFGQNAGTATAQYCYSTGLIFGGGIYGSGYATTLATNCYTSGLSFATPTSGIYAGSGTDGALNYSEANHGNSGSWSSLNAASAGISPGSIWISTGMNIPYLFANSGATPYQLTNITFDASGSVFIIDFAGSVVQGGSTDAAVLPAGYTYEILDSPSAEISIDAATGAITVGVGLSPDTYSLTIYSHINPYSVTTYTLTVTGLPASAATTCCGSFVGQSNLDYATIFQVKGGNALITDSSNPRNKFTSYQDMFRMKTALAFHR